MSKNNLQKLRNQLNQLVEQNKTITKSKYSAFKLLIATGRTKKLTDLLNFLTNTTEKINLSNFKKNIVESNNLNLLKKEQLRQITKKLNSKNIQNYSVNLHYDQINKLMKKNPSSYIVHAVQFFNKKNKEIFKYPYDTKIFKFTKNETKTKRYDRLKQEMEITTNQADYQWICKLWCDPYYDEYTQGNYCILTSTAYNKVDVVNKTNFNQIYKLNDTNTCVYDGFLEYFNNGCKLRKTIYNKLIKNKKIYAKAYSNETLHEICEFTNSSLTIKDLITQNDIKINEKSTNKYNLIFLNTKYDHLDLLTHTYTEPTEVDNKEEYEKIKRTSDFYIESFGKLITLEGTFKVKDSDFNIEYKKWKEAVNYNDLLIDVNNEEMKMIDKYDYSTHCFFNKFEVNNELYDELDQVKSYYNYSNTDTNHNYHGVPSGSFINIKITDNYDIKTFEEQLNNKIIGFYEVVVEDILNHVNIFEKLGIFKNNTYCFTSVQINSFKHFLKFKFLNISISPSCHVPFTEGMTKKLGASETSKGLPYYSKAYGLMQSTTEYCSTTIKPLVCDLKFYQIINNDEINMFEHNGIIKINKKNEKITTCQHVASYIHSYCKTLIFEQLLKLNINDVFGVKIDSIVLKKNSQIKEILPAFYTDFKQCKIESMLKMRIITDCITGQDRVLDDNGYYRTLYKDDDTPLNFKPSFLPDNKIITSPTLFLSGAGGCGKSHSILSNLKSVCMVSTCWNLTQNKKEEFGIKPLSINKLLGKTGLQASEKVIVKEKFIFCDELTMWEKEDVIQVINDNPRKFIFLAGDIDYNGKFYQCSLQNKVINPSKIKNLQFITYTKNYRFDEQLNDILVNFRKCETQKQQNEYIKLHFKDNFRTKEQITWDDKTYGISDIKDNIKLEEYFYKNGANEKYYIKNTNFTAGQYKGASLDAKPNHYNFESKLFKTIHSYQGLTIERDERIVINNKLNFDRNLWYTALSRARNLNQIIILI